MRLQIALTPPISRYDFFTHNPNIIYEAPFFNVFLFYDLNKPWYTFAKIITNNNV